MSLGITVNFHKNGILLAYIANKIPNIRLRKLLKIIYLIDEHFMKMRGFPLTWFDYYAWAKGPVAPEVYAIKDNAFSDFVSLRRDENGKCVINAVNPSHSITLNDTGEFSQSEIDTIDLLLNNFKDKSADELSDITHVPDSIWSKIVADNNISFDKEKKSEIRIPLTMLFESGDYRLDVYDDAEFCMEFQKQLNANRNPNHRVQLDIVTPSEREKYRIPAYTPLVP